MGTPLILFLQLTVDSGQQLQGIYTFDCTLYFCSALPMRERERERERERREGERGEREGVIIWCAISTTIFL